MSGVERGVHYFPEGGTYQQFIEQHLLGNEPCMFGEWVSKRWAARTHWVMQDGSPNFNYLAKQYGTGAWYILYLSYHPSPSGDANVSVANCSQCKFWTHPTTEVPLRDYLQYWQSHDSVQQACDHDTAMTSAPLKHDEKLYLKDWHFVK